MKAVVFSLVVMGISAGAAYGQCDECIDSACPSYYVWVQPGSDILPIGGAGCQYVGGSHCGDAIPCDIMSTPFDEDDLDQLEEIAATGSAMQISEEIQAHPALELVGHRNAIVVKGCNDRLIALIPIRPTEVAAVGEALSGAATPTGWPTSISNAAAAVGIP